MRGKDVTARACLAVMAAVMIAVIAAGIFFMAGIRESIVQEETPQNKVGLINGGAYVTEGTYDEKFQ